MDKISQLFNYHTWATSQLLFYIENEVPEAFSAKIKSVFPSIEETFRHQYEVDLLWFNRINKMFDGVGNPSFSTAGECYEEFTSLHKEIQQYIETCPDLNQVVQYQNSTGEVFTNRIGDLLQHLVNHGTYHRGNISAMLRQQGYKGYSTDYIFYLREISG